MQGTPGSRITDPRAYPASQLLTAQGKMLSHTRPRFVRPRLMAGGEARLTGSRAYAYFFSSDTFPVVLVPHVGQRMSTSLGLPMNFSLIFSGGIKLISPQAQAGHSA